METQQEYKMTKYEWEIMLKELQKVFSIVRLLNEEELRTGRIQGSTDDRRMRMLCTLEQTHPL